MSILDDTILDAARAVLSNAHGYILRAGALIARGQADPGFAADLKRLAARVRAAATEEVMRRNTSGAETTNEKKVRRRRTDAVLAEKIAANGGKEGR